MFSIKMDGKRIISNVYDTYDRDWTALATYVAGCDLKKSMATPPSDEDVDEAIEAARQQSLRHYGKPSTSR
jgi:predicted small lipoprotein YifL